MQRGRQVKFTGIPLIAIAFRNLLKILLRIQWNASLKFILISLMSSLEFLSGIHLHSSQEFTGVHLDFSQEFIGIYLRNSSQLISRLSSWNLIRISLRRLFEFLSGIHCIPHRNSAEFLSRNNHRSLSQIFSEIYWNSSKEFT